MIWSSDSKRFTAALAGSCLMHSAVILMPYLGAGGAGLRGAVKSGQPARLITVTMLEAIAPAASAPKDSQGEPRRQADPLRPAPPPPVKAGALPFPVQDFYPADKLTKRPRPTSEPDLGTPVSGRTFPSGLVILRLWISEFGDVVSADVETSDLPDVLSARAAAAFAKLRFEPGEIHGRRVPSLVRIEVTYNDPPPVRP